MGLQTYVGNNCKQPHLYQLLSSWDTLITCGIEDKCHEEHCAHICDVTYKDPIINETLATSLNTDGLTDAPISTELTTKNAQFEAIALEGEIPTTLTVLPTTPEVTEIVNETASTIESPSSPLTHDYNETTQTEWPMQKAEQKLVEKLVEDDVYERKKRIKPVRVVSVTRSAAERNMCYMQTVVLGLVLCLF